MKTDRAPFRALVALLVLGLAACGGGEDAGSDAAPDTEPAPEPAMEPATPDMPDPTFDAVWAYLQANDFESWPLLPGTSEFYQGQDPHGALLTTRVNPTALDAYEAGTEGDMSPGGMTVKFNFTPDSTLAAVTVMYKTEDFNPEHQNWWFLKRNADETVPVAGRGTNCENCHSTAEGDDYLFLTGSGM